MKSSTAMTPNGSNILKMKSSGRLTNTLRKANRIYQPVPKKAIRKGGRETENGKYEQGTPIEKTVQPLRNESRPK